VHAVDELADLGDLPDRQDPSERNANTDGAAVGDSTAEVVDAARLSSRIQGCCAV